MFIRKARREGGVKRLLAALRTPKRGATDDMIHAAGGNVLFGTAHDVALWSGRLRAREALSQRFVAQDDPRLTQSSASAERFLPVALHRGNKVEPVADKLTYKRGDELTVLVSKEHLEEALHELANMGWEPDELSRRQDPLSSSRPAALSDEVPPQSTPPSNATHPTDADAPESSSSPYPSRERRVPAPRK